MIRLLEFVTATGASPFGAWRATLDPVTRARVTTAVLRLELGNFSAAKGVGSGVLELRLDFGPGYRVYFAKDGERLVLLLGGGTKKRQQNDIEAAHQRWREYKRLKKGETGMRTQKFSDTVRKDLVNDAAFRGALLSEAMGCMIAGDVETGKIVLREYVNGTVGFQTLGEALGRSPKSLMRMLSPQGNPQARNLFEMVAYLQKAEGTVLRVHAAHANAA